MRKALWGLGKNGSIILLVLFVTSFATAQAPIIIVETHRIGSTTAAGLTPIHVRVMCQSILGTAQTEKHILIDSESLTQTQAVDLMNAIPRMLELYRLWRAEEGGPDRGAIFIAGNISIEVRKRDTTFLYWQELAVLRDEAELYMSELQRLLRRAIDFTP